LPFWFKKTIKKEVGGETLETPISPPKGRELSIIKENHTLIYLNKGKKNRFNLYPERRP